MHTARRMLSATYLHGRQDPLHLGTGFGGVPAWVWRTDPDRGHAA